MGSKSRTKDTVSSKRAPASNDHQATPASKRAKSNNEISSSISLSDEAPETTTEMDMDQEDQQINKEEIDTKEGEEDEEEDNDIDMGEEDRESTDQETDVEDDEDQELRLSAPKVQQKQAHTSDRVQKQLTNPEIEAAFHDQYMTQITQAFGDELNTLRETDSLEGPHLELLIDSLNQTGHIFRVMEKELWVAGDPQ
ncbi:hypothetical protein BGZ83_004128 [Gryganskiella cystojenkinii]|nr:hypothetical protein BGZ83_004128 [Gryganskiella cystojenkinii]